MSGLCCFPPWWSRCEWASLTVPGWLDKHSGFGPVGRDRSAGAETGGGKYHIFGVNLFSLYQIFLLPGTVRRPGPGGPTICSLCYCCTSRCCQQLFSPWSLPKREREILSGSLMMQRTIYVDFRWTLSACAASQGFRIRECPIIWRIKEYLIWYLWQTTTEFIVQLNCNHVEFKGLWHPDSSNLPKINLGMSLTESPWIKLTVQITDMLHPHRKLVPTVWLNFFSPFISPPPFFMFPCCFSSCDKVDLFPPDLDIRVHHHHES